MWLIRTKLEAPAPTERLIARQRLRRRLPAILRARLALVHAPAGFGKTCLLAEWQRSLNTQRVRTAWLSLDEEDSDPLQFMAYFTASLDAAGIDVGHLAPAAERGFPEVPVSSLIAALNQALQRSRGRTVVLLDDYHRLRGGAVNAVLVSLIQGLGSRISFVIASRERPDFIATDGTLRTSCVEITGDQLRFTFDETRELLERNVGFVSEEDLRVIAAGTDGWGIALAAVRDWLTSGWSTTRVCDSLARPAADLTRYVTDQILRGLSATEHEFLLRTAIADRFSESLAKALCTDVPVEQVISALERKDLLVVIWDGNERWFRYHRLLAELAVTELVEARRNLAEDLHGRAAEWFFQAGHHAEAVRHALATRDDRLLAQLFERGGGWKLVVTGHVGLSRNALTLISPQVLRDYPRAQLARILMLAKLGKIDEARSEIDRLKAMHLPSADALLGAETTILEACVERYQDAPVDAKRCAAFSKVANAVPQEHAVLHATFANILCTLQYECGDLEAALATGEEAAAHYRDMNSLYGEVFVYVHQGHALIEIGRLRDAEATLRQAWRLARDTTGPNTETEAVAAVMLAAAVYERGDLDEAESLLTSALPAIEQGESWFDLLCAGYSTAASLGLNGRGPVLSNLAHRMQQTAARRDLERLRRFADVIELRTLTTDGPLMTEAVAVLEAALSTSIACATAPRIRLRMALELARLSLARGAMTQALGAAGKIAEECRALRHVRLGIEASIVEALAAHGLGDAGLGRRLIDGAISLAMHEGFSQLFRDFGEPLLPLLESAMAGGPDPGSPRVRDQFLRSLMEGIRAPKDGTANAALTDRERGVLRLLGEGLSNKAIARALRVSDNTVKFHLKNIFTKLDVGTRAEAMRVAASVTPLGRDA
ncbi:MAG: LuxR C-terminal-related transcriptional regulator [Steroidobacteraceae bacterium]